MPERASPTFDLSKFTRLPSIRIAVKFLKTFQIIRRQLNKHMQTRIIQHIVVTTLSLPDSYQLSALLIDCTWKQTTEQSRAITCNKTVTKRSTKNDNLTYFFRKLQSRGRCLHSLTVLECRDIMNLHQLNETEQTTGMCALYVDGCTFFYSRKLTSQSKVQKPEGYGHHENYCGRRVELQYSAKGSMFSQLKWHEVIISDTI